MDIQQEVPQQERRTSLATRQQRTETDMEILSELPPRVKQTSLATRQLRTETVMVTR